MACAPAYQIAGARFASRCAGVRRLPGAPRGGRPLTGPAHPPAAVQTQIAKAPATRARKFRPRNFSTTCPRWKRATAPSILPACLPATPAPRWILRTCAASACDRSRPNAPAAGAPVWTSRRSPDRSKSRRCVAGFVARHAAPGRWMCGRTGQSIARPAWGARFSAARPSGGLSRRGRHAQA